MKVLLVEDERQLSEALVSLLKRERYIVDAVYDGISGEEYALDGTYDAIILDIMLPGQDGLTVLSNLRREGLSTPILLLTAKSEVEEKISGLDLGADDYLTKPFSSAELLARVRALCRRQGSFTADILCQQETFLDRSKYQLCYKANTVKLSAKEFQILEMLMMNHSQIIPKERLIEKVWGFDSEVEYNTIEVYISFIRKKMAAIGSPLQIKAVRGIGYVLEDEK